MDSDWQIIMRFGREFSSDIQGRAMLHLEKWLRDQHVPAEVLKETAPDDSKLRSLMTLEKRMELK